MVRHEAFVRREALGVEGGERHCRTGGTGIRQKGVVSRYHRWSGLVEG